MSAQASELARCEASVRAMPGQVERMRPAVTFKAWRVGTDGKTAQEVGCGEAETLDDAMRHAATLCQHKDGLFVLREDAGRAAKMLRVCQIKRESRRNWIRNPVTGVPEPVQRLYAVALWDVAVDAFDPSKGPSLAAVCADPVRFDPDLVEG